MRKVIEEFYCDVCGRKVDNVYGIMMPMGTDRGGIEKENSEEVEDENAQPQIEMVGIDPTLIIRDVEMCGDCIKKNVNIYSDNDPDEPIFRQEPAPENFVPFIPEEHPELVTAEVM